MVLKLDINYSFSKGLDQLVFHFYWILFFSHLRYKDAAVPGPDL